MVLGSWRRGEWPEYVTVSHEGMREVGRRYVPERTCRLVYYDDGDGYPPNVQCSACGRWLDEYASPDYCPNCGAKVVE